MTESSPAPDIFDLNQAEVVTGKEPKAETLSADVEQRPAKAKPASGVKDLVVKFMLGGAVVFGALWIFAPGLFSGSPSSRTVAAQTSFSPVEAMQKASEHAAESQQLEGPARAKSASAAVPEQEVEELLGTLPTSFESQPAGEGVSDRHTPAGEVDQIEERQKLLAMIGELKATAADSNNRLALLETAVLANQRRLDAATKAVQIQAASKKDQTPLHRRYRQGSNSSAPVKMLSDFKLNTIYPGVAWVQKNDQVHLVQVGDRLGDLKVTGIDVAGRAVRTDRGVIR